VLPLVGIMLLSMREIIIVCVITIFSLFLFVRLMGDVPDETFKDLTTFAIIMEAFIIFASHQRNQLEAERQAQTIENAKVRILAQFIQDVSHEFMTPLAIISTGLYLITRTSDAQVRQQRAVTVQAQITYITTLLEDMLTMTRLDTRTAPSIDWLSVNDIIREIVNLIEPEAVNKGLAVDLNLQSEVPAIRGDSAELQLALAHLLRNAVAYTREGRISVSTSARQSAIVIDIRDTGVGIAPEDQEHIFERFYRVDQARTTRGAGLGLAICKKIVEDHHGTIEVESEVGQGSIFRISLP
jgi:signal transduction histidine kinase